MHNIVMLEEARSVYLLVVNSWIDGSYQYTWCSRDSLPHWYPISDWRRNDSF